MNEDLKIFSEELKKIREEKNITIDNIHNSTRIDKKFIKAIESGEFNIIDELYIKAFLREYAVSIGLNSAEVVRKYELAKSGKLAEYNENNAQIIEEKSPNKPKVFVSSDLSDTTIEYSQKNNRQLLIPLLGISFLVIVALIYLIFIKDSKTIIVQQKPFDEVLEDIERYDDSERFSYSGIDSTAVDSSNNAKLKLMIKAKDKVWIRVIIDKKNQDEFFISKDSTKILNASHNFSLLLGNAGVVSLILNGKPLNFSAKLGEIKNVLIDSTGLKLLYINDKEKDYNER